MNLYKNAICLFTALIIVMSTLFGFSISASAKNPSGSNNSVKWEINKNGVLSVSPSVKNSTVKIPDYSLNKRPGWYKYSSQIKSIKINANITRIGNYAFYGLKKAKDISIGKNVKELGTASFGRTEALKKYKVVAGNSSFTTSSGVLYNSTKTLLAAFPASKNVQEFTIPSSVTTIQGYAFHYAKKVKTITQKTSSVKSIGTHAFAYCALLEKVNINNNCNSLGAKALYGVTTLKSVTVPPSVESIGKDLILPSKQVKKLTVHCAYGSKIHDYLKAKGGYAITNKEYRFNCTFEPGAEATLSTKKKTVVWGSKYGELPTPVKEGYKFSGWYVDNKLITANTKVSIANDHTLKASFEGQQYVVDLNPNFGICDTQKITVTYGKPFGELPEAVKNGYEFLGWYTQDGQKVYTDTLFTNENINILIAKYRKNVSATTGLKIKYKTKNSVRLAWNKQRDVTGYEVFKKVNSGKYTNCAVVTQNYTTLSLKAKKRYTFKVRAFVIDGDSKQYGDFSSEVSRAKTYLAKPKLKKSVSKSGVLTVKWKSVSNAKKYQIFQYKNRKWKKVKTTTATKIYVITKPHKTYRFKVRAFCTVLKHRCYSAFGKIKHKA